MSWVLINKDLPIYSQTKFPKVHPGMLNVLQKKKNWQSKILWSIQINKMKWISFFLEIYRDFNILSILWVFKRDIVHFCPHIDVTVECFSLMLYPLRNTLREMPLQRPVIKVQWTLSQIGRFTCRFSLSVLDSKIGLITLLLQNVYNN